MCKKSNKFEQGSTKFFSSFCYGWLFVLFHWPNCVIFKNPPTVRSYDCNDVTIIDCACLQAVVKKNILKKQMYYKNLTSQKRLHSFKQNGGFPFDTHLPKSDSPKADSGPRKRLQSGQVVII